MARRADSVRRALLRLLLHGGPPFWLSLLVGAIVLGGQPDDPLAALLAASAAFVCARLVRRATADRLRR